MSLLPYFKTATNNDEITLNVTSYNMHGFHQGYALLEDLCSVDCPDVLLLQEHWLTPDNLYSLSHLVEFSYFSIYFVYLPFNGE